MRKIVSSLKIAMFYFANLQIFYQMTNYFNRFFEIYNSITI